MLVTTVTLPIIPDSFEADDTTMSTGTDPVLRAAVHDEILRQLKNIVQDHESRIRLIERLGWVIFGMWLLSDKLPEVIKAFK